MKVISGICQLNTCIISYLKLMKSMAYTSQGTTFVKSFRNQVNFFSEIFCGSEGYSIYMYIYIYIYILPLPPFQRLDQSI